MDDWLGIRECGEAFLCGANIVQQRNRVESGIDFLEMGANRFGRASVGSQALVWRRRRAICLAHTCTVPLFGYQLERRLKEVYEQPR